ncbi:MAG: metallophosphoesterase [Micavibrio aeruginosavorus]|uniref:Metallophosphoesterase n=1 Tax=Micavibrio aeruginosavorus TaxID=349221 RepID=A0A7T5R0P3_9BACT|nr:MAG: metallophosphoesterase [Micavibrio aeruginosavorus]
MQGRDYLKTAFVKAAGACGVYGLAPEPFPLRHKIYDIVSPKWPSTHAPLRMAVAADLHVGCKSVTLAKVEEIVGRLNDLGADMILLPGDFLVSDSIQGRHIKPEPIAERLAELKAKYGVYAVLGNHDWYEDGQGLWRELERRHIRVLENDAVKVARPDLPGQDVWVAGLADDTTRKPCLKTTFSRVTTDDPVVLMCHDPGTFLDVDERPVVTVCGHTHGGQMMFPGRKRLQKLPGRAPWAYAYGHIREGGRDLVVSSGIGTSSLPLRFNCPAEFVSLTLRSPV